MASQESGKSKIKKRKYQPNMTDDIKIHPEGTSERRGGITWRKKVNSNDIEEVEDRRST